MPYRIDEGRDLTPGEKKYLWQLGQGNHSYNNQKKFLQRLLTFLFCAILGCGALYFIQDNDVALYIGSLLLVIFLVLFVVYWAVFRTVKDPPALTVLTIEGVFRVEVKKMYRMLEVTCYLGDTPVGIPPHWDSLGYMKEGRNYRCDCVLNPDSPSLFVLSADPCFSIDAEMRSGLNTPPSNDDLKSFIAAAFFIPLFLIAFASYMEGTHSPVMLYRYLTKGFRSEKILYMAPDIPFSELEEHQVLNLQGGVSVFRDGQVVLMPDEKEFFEAFGEYREKAALREGLLQKTQYFFGEGAWSLVSDMEGNEYYEQLKEEFVSLLSVNKGAIKRYHDDGVIPTSLWQEGRRIIDSYYSDMMEEERVALQKDFQALFKQKGSYRIVLLHDHFSGIPEIQFPIGPDADLQDDTLSSYLSALHDSLSSQNGRKISGIIQEINYDDSGETREILLDSHPDSQYVPQPLILLFLLNLVLGVAACRSTSVLIGKWGRQKRYNRRVDRFYRKLRPEIFLHD